MCGLAASRGCCGRVRGGRDGLRQDGYRRRLRRGARPEPRGARPVARLARPACARERAAYRRSRLRHRQVHAGAGRPLRRRRSRLSTRRRRCSTRRAIGSPRTASLSCRRRARRCRWSMARRTWSSCQWCCTTLPTWKLWRLSAGASCARAATSASAAARAKRTSRTRSSSRASVRWSTRCCCLARRVTTAFEAAGLQLVGAAAGPCRAGARLGDVRGQDRAARRLDHRAPVAERLRGRHGQAAPARAAGRSAGPIGEDLDWFVFRK